MKIALLTTDNREHDRNYSAALPYFGTAPEALLQGFNQMSGVEVHVVSCVKQPVAQPERIAPNIFYHSLVVPKIGWMRTLYSGCVRATRRKLRELSPDIVHGQGTERDCALAASRSGFPNVVTIHGNMKAIAQVHGAGFGSFHWLAERLENSALKRTAGVFCNSAYTENLVAPRAKRTWRVPNALREEFFAPPPQKGNSMPVVLNIGVIDPRKRQLEILAAARRLHARGLRFELHFIGAIPDTDYGKKFSAALAAEKSGMVRHRGKLATAGIIVAMDAADALIHFPTEEAFGLVVAEALARNLKLFAVATGGVLDITTEVAAAELFSVPDFDGLEKALSRWLAAGWPARTDAASLMRDRYHPKMVAQRHVEIYREVLEKMH